MLWLVIASLLSPKQTAGHRTLIANTAFSELLIYFSDTVVISAIRKESHLLGPYEIEISKKNKKVASVKIDYPQSKDFKEDAFDAFFKILPEYSVPLYLVYDVRKFQTSEELYFSYNQVYEEECYTVGSRGILGRKIEKKPDELQILREKSLSAAIDMMNRWIRRRTFLATIQSETNTNKIFIDIIKKITKSEIKSTVNITKQYEIHKEALVNLQDKYRGISIYGLTADLKIDDMIIAINNIQGRSKNRAILNIVELYTDSISSKLSALEQTMKLIEDFLLILNEFFHNKVITFSNKDGLMISCKLRGEPIKYKSLSSGEINLLLLMCDLVLALDQPSLFIIDEPEISLNIKWQRKLIDSLMKIVGTNQVQLILATHSMELISQYNDHVIEIF